MGNWSTTQAVKVVFVRKVHRWRGQESRSLLAISYDLGAGEGKQDNLPRSPIGNVNETSRINVEDTAKEKGRTEYESIWREIEEE